MVTKTNNPSNINADLLTVPELCEKLQLSPGRVRRLFEDSVLAAIRVDGVLKVPASFISQDKPLKELCGTLILLQDGGFDQEAAARWMIAENDLLGTTPIAALLAGRKAEVRRIAQSYAL